MAALVEGVQYGLSSQGNIHENKSLIFVKLTDSAYRAIEDYLKNKNKTSQQPKIQFLGNEGHLSFPSPQNGHGPAFHFSLSGNEDIEGPQGSFECLQSKSRSLEFMGTLPCKMRIQANDDVYAATRQRMAVAEEQHKKNCTQEIKPSGPNIGRKVKVKKIGGIGVLPRRETSPPPHRAIGPPLGSGIAAGGGASKPRNSTFPLSRLEGGSNGSSNHVDSHSMLHSNMYTNGPSNPPIVKAQSGVVGRRNGSNQDIAKRPIKERLIHLLALRPFKKPELYERIIRKEGFKGERNAIVAALQQVAFMNGNTYHLIRNLWNDVQEDWPFYSEQDRQVLKRRKPQNLTPPGSDGSSGSGHSPTSTHPGSPPPAISPAAPSPAANSPANGRLPLPEIPGVKRPGYYDGADGIITKRQRISHFKRNDWPANNNNNNNSNTQRMRMDPVNRRPPEPVPRSGGSPGHHPPRHRHLTPASSPTPPQGRAGRPPREEGEGIAAQGAPSHSPESGAAMSRSGGGGGGRGEPAELGNGSGGQVMDTVACPPVKEKTSQGVGWPGGKSGATRLASPEESFVKSQERVSSGAAAAPSGRGRVTVGCGAETRDEEAESERASSEYPDYLTEYTTIMTSEQRNKYKADFNADYSEYRELHAVVEMVSRKFAELEESLRQHEPGSEAWVSIKDHIVREYQENKRDQQYPEAKKKFQYLHEKLSHIKRLVLEYDSSNPGQVSSVQLQKH